MNDQRILESLKRRGLQAWQAKFVESFLKETSGAFHLLTAPPGTGKAQACIEIATALVASRQANRILVLVPSQMSEEWRSRLGDSQSQVPVLHVTRQALREMVATVGIGQSPWNLKGIYIISQDLAKQRDFTLSLSQVEWDLVIFDEAHRLTARQRAALLSHLIETGVAHKLLLVTAPPLPILEDRLHSVPNRLYKLLDPLTVTTWFGELRNWDDRIVELPRVVSKVVTYTRGNDEVQFLSKFLNLFPKPETATGVSRFIIMLLTHRASSSLFAIDQSLQRLRHRLKTSIEEARSLFNFDKKIMGLAQADVDLEEIEPNFEEMSFEFDEQGINLKIVEQCLEEIDRVGTDEKLTTVKDLIHSIIDEETNGIPRICILSMYNDTASYLQTATEDIALASFKISGAVTFSDRQVVVDRFLKSGGLLIGTDGGLSEGLDLTKITNVIHYDLPTNPMIFEQRRGRFERFGRTTPYNMYLLRDDSGVLPLESDLIEAAISR